MNDSLLQVNIPKNWHIKKIHELCVNYDNRRVPISKEKRQGGLIPYYGATGIVDYVSEHIFDEELLLVGEDGADWSKYANTSYLVKGKSWVNNHAHVLKCIKVNPIYLKEYLNFNDLNIFIAGGTRGKLTKGILEKIPVVVPPEEEQEKIAEILETLNNEIDVLEKMVINTQNLRSVLISNLFISGINNKKSKKGDFGDMPEKWEQRKLSDFCKSISNRNQDSKISFVVSVTKYKGIVSSLDYFIKQVYSKNIETYKVIKRNQFAYATIHLDEGSIGYLDIADEAVLSPMYTVFEVDEKVVDVRYLFNLLKSHRLMNIYKHIGKGSIDRRKSISFDDFSSIKIAIPPLEEQKQIVNIITKVDEKILKGKELKNKFIELKKGLMSDLLSGKVRTIMN